MIWRDINIQDNTYIIKVKRSINPILMTSNQFQVSQVFGEFTDFEGQEMQDEFMVLEDYGKIRRAYTLDQDIPSSSIQKYTYYYPFQFNRNISEKYTHELPTPATNHLVFKNIYYKNNNNVYFCMEEDGIS